MHIRDRSAPENAAFIDASRLKGDEALYAGGDVREVAYIVLTDRAGRPWGLLMVNRWRTGKPLFENAPSGSDRERQMEDHVATLLGALGGGALLALQSVGDVGRLNSFMTLEQRGGKLAGDLSTVTRLLLDLDAYTAQGGNRGEVDTDDELTNLLSRTGRLASSLERRWRLTMEIMRERRARGQTAPAQPGRSHRIVSDLDALERLLSGLSLQVLTAVAWSDREDLARVREEWLGAEGFASGTVEREIVEHWLDLAEEAIGLRVRLDEENRGLCVSNISANTCPTALQQYIHDLCVLT